MSTPRAPIPAKLVIGFFVRDKALAVPISETLTEKFGPVDLASPWLPFDDTNYYEPEMGAPLFRRMLSFQTLIRQEMLSEIKPVTNEIEKAHTHDGLRAVNIDPGYLSLERFVLATGKNFTHRIYIGRGIYADLTLIYQKGAFKTLPWTYPDYARQNMIDFLEITRERYKTDLKKQETKT